MSVDVEPCPRATSPRPFAREGKWQHGIACSTGVLGHQFAVEAFDPIKLIPNGVYLSSFFSNYPSQRRIDEIFRHLAAHQLKPVVAAVYRFDEIGLAHELMETNRAMGTIVVVVD